MEDNTRKIKTRGLVTVATGSKQYYWLAANLLKSYRYFSKTPLPFAILTDEENEYTQLFDKVIILEESTKSYMDKVFILNHIPFDETLFIESDIIAYKDLNCFFDAFENADDYSMFGKNFFVDADLTYGLVREKGKEWGWFDPKKISSKYQDRVQSVPQFGSGIVYMRKGDVCKIASQICQDVWKNAKENGLKPIDDEVFAVGMAVSGSKCVPSSPKYNQCVYDHMIRNGWKPEPNMHKGYCHFMRPSAEVPDEAHLCHWGTRYTKTALYKREVKILECRISGNKAQEELWYILYTVISPFSNFAYEIKQKTKKLFKRIKRRLKL